MGVMGSRSSSMSYASTKRKHYSRLLLLALGAAMLSVLLLHKLREGRVLGLVLQDRERQLLTLQMILEKQRAHSKEMKTKIEELKAKAAALRTQKMLLNNRLMEAENLNAYLKNKQDELESTLTDLLKQRQDHAEEMERRLQLPVNASLVDEVSNRNETDESTSKEETATDGGGDGAQISDGAKEVEKSEHAQGSKNGEWVKLETNPDDDGDAAEDGDGTSAEEEDRAKEEVSEEGKHSEEGVQVGGQDTVEAREESQINRTELLQNTTTVNATLMDDVPNRNETDESASKEEIVANRGEDAQTTDGVKKVETSEDGQGSKRGEWVRLETDTDDGEAAGNGKGRNVEEEDHGMEEVSEDGKHSEEGNRVSDQRNTVEARDEDQTNRTELLLNNGTTVEGEVSGMKDEVTSSNTTETSVTASEDGKLEKKDNNGDGEEKKTADKTETGNRGRRSRRRGTKGRKRRAAARSGEQKAEASKDPQAGDSHHDQESSKLAEKPDDQVFDSNATDISTGEAQLKLPADQTASAEAEVAERQTQVNAASLEASTGSSGDGDSEAKGASIESYQDTNGSEEKSEIDNNESNTSEGAGEEDVGPQTNEEHGMRSTMETSKESAASNEGQGEKLHGTEGENPEKQEDVGRAPEETEANKQQLGSEEKGENDEDNEETKTGSTQQAEDREVNEEARLQQEPGAGNATEGKSSGEDEPEEAAGGQSEHDEAGEAIEDEDSKEDVKEF